MEIKNDMCEKKMICVAHVIFLLYSTVLAAQVKNLGVILSSSPPLILHPYPVGTTFKIYPEYDHFSPPLLPRGPCLV